MDGSVSRRAWATLAILGALYIVSFIDRFILALLVAPLKADLGVGDVQLGLLFGTFFALFYGILGLPIARLADRGNRKRLIVASVVVWSVCTVGSAFARDYWTLAALRVGLAIGEAALTPAAFSMLTDTFPPRRRLLAGTLFSAAGMAGASSAFLIGAGVIAWAEQRAGVGGLSAWRLTFIAVGVPGLVLAALFALVVREPTRPADDERPGLRTAFAYLKANQRLWGGLFAGAGAAQMLTYAMLAWSPTLMTRSFGMTAAAAGARLGLAQILATVGGTLVLPILLRALGRRDPRLAAALPATATVLGAGLILAAIGMGDWRAFLLLNAMGTFLLVGATNTVVVLLQPLAPSAIRATLTALLLICISSFGLGLGPPMAALAAGAWTGAGQPLAAGLSTVAVVALILATALFAMAARPLRSALGSVISPDAPSRR